MGQAEYEAFKAKLREWMEAHPEEYAALRESMNTRDMAGCQAVLLQAIALIPQYRKLTAAKANEGLFDHYCPTEDRSRRVTLSDAPDSDQAVPRRTAGGIRPRNSHRSRTRHSGGIQPADRTAACRESGPGSRLGSRHHSRNQGFSIRNELV